MTKHTRAARPGPGAGKELPPPRCPCKTLHSPWIARAWALRAARGRFYTHVGVRCVLLPQAVGENLLQRTQPPGVGGSPQDWAWGAPGGGSPGEPAAGRLGAACARVRSTRILSLLVPSIGPVSYVRRIKTPLDVCCMFCRGAGGGRAGRSTC